MATLAATGWKLDAVVRWLSPQLRSEAVDAELRLRHCWVKLNPRSGLQLRLGDLSVLDDGGRQVLALDQATVLLPMAHLRAR
ncbi:hypothetical protein RZS08_42805, partial [Arthrospira platensis SPKY1]|nr:hypothetical protein [Arthrospira platensis SPKY1]